MSATYNWALRGGSVITINNGNGGGWTIAASADDVRPSNTVYVALFGNDLTGNGSRQKPYRTLAKAVTVGTLVVIGSGTYRESPTVNNVTIVGDGDVVFDGTGLSSLINGNGQVLKNLTIKNYSVLATSYTMAENCIFKDMQGDNANGNSQYQGCTFIRITTLLGILKPVLNVTMNNTYVDCYNLQIQNSAGLQFAQWNHIFYGCNLAFTGPSFLSYCLFYHCNFRFNAGYTAPAVKYPSVPAGFSQLNTLADVQAAHTAGYSTAVIVNFPGCAVADPLFNNYPIGDFTLQFGSPAKNLSYRGTYAGAHSVAQALKIRATESAGDFEFSSAVNLTIADDSLTLTSTAADAQIDTNVIVNLLGRELANFPAYGFNADRNGQYIDSIADLAPSVKSPGDTLNVPASYEVQNGAIVYNSGTYQAGTRLTTVSGQTTFSSASSGVLREILEAPQRHTVLARFSDGGAAVTAGTALDLGYYYYVQSGTINYNGTDFTSGKIFKAADTNPFSGSGTVIAAFGTESYQHYEQGTKPTSNNTGDSRTGSIIRGNGDPAYVRGGMGVTEFPINSRFIQIRYMIKVNNLKSA